MPADPSEAVPPGSIAAEPPSAATRQAESGTPPAPRRSSWKWIVGLAASIVVLAFGIPKLLHALRTVSTDDAYVNSYVTFVAPRVGGQVARVLVDDNNRVRKGDVLVELDPEPYQVQLAIKQAAVDNAEADLAVANASVRAQIGLARSARFKLVRTIEDVNNQVALIRARAAQWEQSKATLTLAQAEFDRAKDLLAKKVTSPEEFDQRRSALDVAQAQVTQNLEGVFQARVALGLPGNPPAGQKITDVPPDLDQTFSAVREALATLLQAAAPLGIVPSSFNETPKEVIDEFYRRDPSGDVDKIYQEVIRDAPALKQAQSKLASTQRDLDQAKLNLRYCQIVSEIDGVVTRRNVNPGNNVQVGQSLMAVRSLKDIWVDANFKETQLRDLRIGQRVDLQVDMYGSKQRFEGRISGFTMGTGSTLALLPAQNATGNFVKVVQRLPVRIDLIYYDPDKAPLFVGLSVEPEVDLHSKPEGSNAGQYLQAMMPAPSAPAMPTPVQPGQPPQSSVPPAVITATPTNRP